MLRAFVVNNMRIDGITICVGELYARYLAQVLPYWLTTLDGVTIVTRPADPVLGQVLAREAAAKLRIVTTDVFTVGGAHFNKGAALNIGYVMTDPRHWVLAFDCDMQPPLCWRRVAEREAIAGQLYGAPRSARAGFAPFGYFQLWHARDPLAAPSPRTGGPFSERYGHAGRYDREFFERWPAERRHALPIQLRHLGPPRRHWHGPGNERLTQALFRDGVAAYRARDVSLDGGRDEHTR